MILFSQTAYLHHKDSWGCHCLLFCQFYVCPMLIIYYFVESLASLNHTYGHFYY